MTRWGTGSVVGGVVGLIVLVVALWIGWVVFAIFNVIWLVQHIIQVYNGDVSFTPIFWGILNIIVIVLAVMGRPSVTTTNS